MRESGADGGFDLKLISEKDEFSAGKLVLHYRRRIPLPQLSKLLFAEEGRVKGELVELINEKYTHFVLLSEKMQDLSKLTQPLIEPLRENRRLCEHFG